MIDLLTALSERFDLVILDTPPVSVVPDAIPLMRLVTRCGHRRPQERDHADAARQLRDQLTNLRAHTGRRCQRDARQLGQIPGIRLYGAVDRGRAHPEHHLSRASPSARYPRCRRISSNRTSTRASRISCPTCISNVPARSLTPNLIVLADARHARLALSEAASRLYRPISSFTEARRLRWRWRLFPCWSGRSYGRHADSRSDSSSPWRCRTGGASEDVMPISTPLCWQPSACSRLAASASP